MGYCKNISKIWECDYRDRCIFSSFFYFHIVSSKWFAVYQICRRNLEAIICQKNGKGKGPIVLSRHWKIVKTISIQNFSGIPKFHIFSRSSIFVEHDLRLIESKYTILGGFATEAHRKTAPCIIFEQNGCGLSSKRDLERRTFCQTSVRGCVLAERFRISFEALFELGVEDLEYCSAQSFVVWESHSVSSAQKGQQSYSSWN